MPDKVGRWSEKIAETPQGVPKNEGDRYLYKGTYVISNDTIDLIQSETHS